ncbi:S-type pyocin domain-containing protein [Pectobacterium actinidiae]|uniref:S-type pyocin domain-containing protein n=1 Tax=Pectobacterium actinidiae TaxID=1507808 RepID=UPI0023AB1976|nr:S-type pyocin domain-containing protein [Pectobacterium actinidiae]WEF10965.1 S-type pyocin domain-containing protein [Pectobacterium actinidiae]
MGSRSNVYGRGQALEGDKTTTGAVCIASLSNDIEYGRRVLRVGDKTTPCPKCGKPGEIVSGELRDTNMGRAAAVDGSIVLCGCPTGANKVIAPVGQWVGKGREPSVVAREKRMAERRVAEEAEEKRLAEERERNRVFAKSCLRGEGCNDAGEQREPHTNFAEMAFYQAVPADDPAIDSDVPQHAQAAKKKKPVEDIPEPKKRSALYKWWFGNHEEMDYQAAKAAAASTTNTQTAVEGASVLGLVGGRAITSGTWAVKLGEMATGLGRIAASGPGAPIAAVVMGMMPGRLNDGEQDFIDRMRLEQMREAPSRVRYTWENDSQGNPVPHGWHTPPGKDRVRVRKMEWDNTRKAYTFTTEEEQPVIIIWTPDSSGVNVPSNTGNQNPVRIPNPVVVDPLPENTNIDATTSPAPEEKTFADYILILPLPNIPPIYIYLRNNPGQVTGKGQKVSGIWLSDANAGNGSPIPSQIADKLRGRTFGNFDQFRKAFWQEVSKDPELSRQFKRGNSGNIKVGKAPAPRENEQVGAKIKYEIHHIKPISEGGEVYNVDNMGIVTPKRHIDIHRGG